MGWRFVLLLLRGSHDISSWSFLVLALHWNWKAQRCFSPLQKETARCFDFYYGSYLLLLPYKPIRARSQIRDKVLQLMRRECLKGTAELAKGGLQGIGELIILNSNNPKLSCVVCRSTITVVRARRCPQASSSRILWLIP